MDCCAVASGAAEKLSDISFLVLDMWRAMRRKGTQRALAPLVNFVESHGAYAYQVALRMEDCANAADAMCRERLAALGTIREDAYQYVRLRAAPRTRTLVRRRNIFDLAPLGTIKRLNRFCIAHAARARAAAHLDRPCHAQARPDPLE
jgi:hypothetical protein